VWALFAPTRSEVRDDVTPHGDVAHVTTDSGLVDGEDGLDHWRRRTLDSLFLALALVVLVAYLPSVVASVRAGVWSIAVVDTVAAVWFLYLAWARHLSTTFRAVSLVASVYLLGVVLLAVLGLAGAGFQWLLGCCAFAAVLWGRRAAVAVVAATAASVVVVAGLTVSLDLAVPIPEPSPLLWAVHGGNLLLLGAMIVASTGTVVAGLFRGIERQRSARRALETQRQRLETANLELGREIAFGQVQRDRIGALQAETEEAFRLSIHLLARAAEIHDEGTAHHVERVSEYAWVLSSELGLRFDFCEELRFSAQLHDVGKMSIDMGILRKVGALTEAEQVDMRRHTSYGWKILSTVDRLGMAAEIARAHHERWDGSGYPDGAAEEAIPMAARIVALADVYDALRSPRPYKPPYDHERAVEILRDGDSRIDPARHFDPRVQEVFLLHHRAFAAIYQRLAG